MGGPCTRLRCSRLAFASYNLGLPLTLRSAFYPLMGKEVWGRFGHGINILAVFATLFGLATLTALELILIGV